MIVFAEGKVLVVVKQECPKGGRFIIFDSCDYPVMIHWGWVLFSFPIIETLLRVALIIRLEAGDSCFILILWALEFILNIVSAAALVWQGSSGKRNNLASAGVQNFFLIQKPPNFGAGINGTALLKFELE